MDFCDCLVAVYRLLQQTQDEDSILSERFDRAADFSVQVEICCCTFCGPLTLRAMKAGSA